MNEEHHANGESTRLERAGEVAARVGSLQPSDPRARRGLHAGLAIMVVLSIALAALAAAGEWPDLEWRFRPWMLLLSALAMVAFMIAVMEIWRRLMRTLGAELPRGPAATIWFTSGLGRYVPTGALMPVLRMALAEPVGAPKRISLAAVVYETAIFFAAAVLVGSYAVIQLPDLEGNPLRFGVLLIPLAAIVALHPRIFHRLADLVLERLGRAKLPTSLSLTQVIEYMLLYLPPLLVGGLAVYTAAQLVYPLGREDLILVIGAFAASNAIAFLAFMLPGGLGAREAALALTLSPVMPAAPAVAVAVAVRIVQIAVEVLLALGSQLLNRRRSRLRAEPMNP